MTATRDDICPQCGHSIAMHDSEGCSACDCTLRNSNFVLYLCAEMVAAREELDDARNLMRIYIKERDIALRKLDSVQRLAHRYFVERTEAREWAVALYKKLRRLGE